MTRHIVIIVLSIAVSITASSFFEKGNAQAQNMSPVVIELFTSQSCSSCPPADKLLGEYARQDNVIALSCNVTYWNHLRWKDTLSKQFCTDRQAAYRDALHNRNSFTPQVIVNGQHSAVGSRKSEVNQAIMESAPFPLKEIGLSLNSGMLSVNLPHDAQTEKATLLLIQYDPDYTQEIRSGENRGKTVTYTNPVQIIRPIGSWNGEEKEMSIPLEVVTNGIAVIAQQGNAGPISAAGKLPKLMDR